MDQPYDIFLSHKSEHKPWVVWLAEALEQYGYKVFLDIWNLVPGESWVEGLERGVSNCRAAVLVATPETVASGWVRQEYQSLLRRRQTEPGFRLIPIVFGEIPHLPFLHDIQAVDFRDPADYRRALYRLLCGLRGEEPGPHVHLPIPIEAPPSLRAAAASDMTPGEQSFLQSLMARMQRPGAQPLLILSRGQRHQGPAIRAMLDAARAGYGPSGVLHITPPYSARVDTAAYFQELSRQCGIAPPAADAVAFQAAIEQRLQAGERLFLLVSGFENANQDCRCELAGALRGLTDRHDGELRLALFGGQRLAEQKFVACEHSFLSHAEAREWPDPDLADVLAWQGREFPRRSLDAGDADALLAACGGHAGQIRACLEHWESESGEPDWPAWCYRHAELWESWYRLGNGDREALRAALAREDFGPSLTWPPNADARRLYWADLLQARNGRLVWRSDTVRLVGREVLA